MEGNRDGLFSTVHATYMYVYRRDKRLLKEGQIHGICTTFMCMVIGDIYTITACTRGICICTCMYVCTYNDMIVSSSVFLTPHGG